MRNRITDYTFTPGTRSITLTKFDAVTVPDLRLIVNETQKYIICSSMQKDLVTCSGNAITFVDTLPALQYGDQLTIEVDTGSDVIYSGGLDWVVEKKVNSIAPLEQQEPWILSYEMGQQLKPLVEAGLPSSIFTDAIASFFAWSLCRNADISAWTKIIGLRTAQMAFAHSNLLETITASGITEISGENTTNSTFLSCASLKRVNFPSLEKISGVQTARYMFQNCTALEEVEMPQLRIISSYQGADGTFFGCTNLKKVDMRGLQVVEQTNAVNAIFGNCLLLREIHLGVGSLSKSAAYLNPLGSTTNVTDLYLYGTPTDNIYITWAPLNFESVMRVMRHITHDPDSATGKILSFKSGLSFQVSLEDYENYMDVRGILVSDLGWTIQNEPTVTQI